jgi:hypothetical protein
MIDSQIEALRIANAHILNKSFFFPPRVIDVFFVIVLYLDTHPFFIAVVSCAFFGDIQKRIKTHMLFSFSASEND